MKTLKEMLFGRARVRKLKIVESISGNWHYHLSENGKTDQPALCGNTHVMHSPAPLATWGHTSHLHEHYCTECMAVAGTWLDNEKRKAR